MKKIMNRSETMVPEMCAGIALAYPELEFVKRYKIIKKREQNADKVSLKMCIRDRCRASSSMPLLSPIVNIDGVPYLDGGLADSVPVRRALKLENEKIVLVLTRNPGYRKKPISKGTAKLYRRAYKKYPNLVHAAVYRNHVYNKTMELVERLEEEEKIFVIRPLVPTVSRLERDEAALSTFYQHGYNLMKRQREALQRYLEK